MTRTQISTIALAVSALFVGQAMAADNGPATRAQVKAELAEAVRTGNVVANVTGELKNQAFPKSYPAQQNVASKSRDQVRAELADAVRTGNVIANVTGQRMNQAYPQAYASQQNVASSSPASAGAELAEAARDQGSES